MDFEAAANDQPDNYRWWTHTDEFELAQDMFRVYQALEAQDKRRQDANLHHLRMYGNLPVEGVNPWDFNRYRDTEDRLTLNVIAAACDIATARIGKQKPAAKILPQGGNYTLRRKSKLMGRFLDAQFRISRVYEQSRRSFLDAAVLGTGCLKVFDTKTDIKVERVFPSEVLVDPMESLYGEPTQLFQRKWVPRDLLRHMYLQKKRKGKMGRYVRTAIEDATDGCDPSVGDFELKLKRETVGDQVLVVEAWKLPSAPGAGDGKHALVTESGPLFVEDYDKDYLPFLFFRWKERLRGFWGCGIAEELCSIQIEINRLLQRIQLAHKRLGVPLIFLDARSKVQENALTNEVGAFVKFMGNAPTVATFQTTHPETYAQLDRLWTRAFDIVGISQDSAAPAQESISGVSAQMQHEIGTERFSIQAQRFEELHIDLARQLIDKAKDVASRNPKFGLPSPNDKHSISTIRWKDVDMKQDEYIIQVLPVSSLPQLPGPKMDRVLLMLQAGLVDPETARELLDMPDLEQFQDMARSASDNIDRIIEHILDEGIYEAPEPFMDIRLALKKTQAAYNKALSDGVPEENLQLLRDFMDACNDIHQAAQAEQMNLAVAQAAEQGPVAPGPGAPPAPGPAGAPPMAANPSDGLA